MRKMEETRNSVFVRMILSAEFMDHVSNRLDAEKWRICHNEESKNLFRNPDVITEITRKIFM